MALVKCKECSKEISNDAVACPHCGAKPPKKTSRFTIVVGGFFALVVAMSVFRTNDPPPTPTPVVAQVKQAAVPSRYPQCAGNTEQAKCEQRLDELANETPEQKKARIKKMNETTAAEAKLAKEAVIEEKKAERIAKAQKKKEGVRIGMSKQDVLDSSWGRPRDINRTTNSRGIHEQWVYDGGYLYFDDGVLRSIQN